MLEAFFFPNGLNMSLKALLFLVIFLTSAKKYKFVFVQPCGEMNRFLGQWINYFKTFIFPLNGLQCVVQILSCGLSASDLSSSCVALTSFSPRW